MTDADFMRRALFHAGRAEGVTTPESDGRRGGRRRRTAWSSGRAAIRAPAQPHAEVFALDDAGERARGATLFVTLEPCCHTGRTGPVHPAHHRRRHRAASSPRCADPNPLVSGKGFDELRAHGIDGRRRRARRRGARG